MENLLNIEHDKITFFQEIILNWYEKNGRHFLWRNPSASNYLRIISEVMLQRTKAETVANFLPDFVRKYPSWKKLGSASKEDLQEILRPIGLHRQRGARLYNLAQEMKRRKGRFPKDKSQVQDMSMVGHYIANAYELFILNRPSPLLDVNMARVLERFFGPRKLSDIRYDPYLKVLSQKIVQVDNPKVINWAILDFGALVCQAKKPQCASCALTRSCLYGSNRP